MATTRGIAPELLEPWVSDIFFKRFKDRQRQYESIFNVMPSSRAFEDDFEVAGLGTYTIKPEGVPLQYDNPVQGDRRRVVMLTYALGFRVTMEMMEDDQHGIISKLPSDLSDSAYYSMETLAFGVINDAFAGSTYTGLPEGDGTRRSLCNTGHVFLRSPGSTWSNSLSPAVALSVSGIEAAITMFRTQKNEEERYTVLTPKTLLCREDLYWTAHKLLTGDKEAFTADNTANIIAQQGLQTVTSPHITSTTAWWLLTEKSDHTLHFYNRKTLTFGESTDSDTFDKKYQSHYRAAVCFKKGLGVVGSNA